MMSSAPSRRIARAEAVTVKVSGCRACGGKGAQG